jgi:hypothetical protein
MALAEAATSTKLAGLFISEVSAVDQPANLLGGWLVTKSRDGTIPLLKQASARLDIDALVDDLFAEAAKANPHQHRGADGRYREHIPGLTDRTEPPPARVAPVHPPPADDLPAEKQTRFFRPVTNAYRRIF